VYEKFYLLGFSQLPQVEFDDLKEFVQSEVEEAEGRGLEQIRLGHN
jgi:hypothetical protein